eukprot:scaffold1803_cov150-Skeletonema_marinoi.AAC.8
MAMALSGERSAAKAQLPPHCLSSIGASWWRCRKLPADCEVVIASNQGPTSIVVCKTAQLVVMCKSRENVA